MPLAWRNTCRRSHGKHAQTANRHMAVWQYSTVRHIYVGAIQYGSTVQYGEIANRHMAAWQYGNMAIWQCSTVRHTPVGMHATSVTALQQLVSNALRA